MPRALPGRCWTRTAAKPADVSEARLTGGRPPQAAESASSKRDGHPDHAVLHALDLLEEFLLAGALVVELPVPDARLVERPVAGHLQDLQRRRACSPTRRSPARRRCGRSPGRRAAATSSSRRPSCCDFTSSACQTLITPSSTVVWPMKMIDSPMPIMCESRKPGPVVGGVGGEDRAHTIRGHERAVAAALQLRRQVPVELVAVILAPPSRAPGSGASSRRCCR